MSPVEAVRSTKVVCECLGVTEGEIRDAMRRYSLTDLAGVRAITGAGTGCGCCAPEIKALLAEDRARRAYFPSEICSAR